MKKINSIFPILASLLLLQACNNHSNRERDEENIRKAYLALSQKDYSSFTNLCTPDFKELALAPQAIQGIEASLTQYKVFLDAFPDLKFDIQSIVPAGTGRYFLEIHLSGTNTGNFMNLPATNKKIDVKDIDIVTINEKGLCTSHWSANPGGALSQIGYGSINNPNTGLIMQAYEAFGKGDIPALLAMCQDDVKFEVHDRTLDSKIRMYSGKQEVSQFFKDINDKMQYSKFQPVRFIADGEDVFIKVDVNFLNKSNQKKYSNSYAHQFQTRDGKIVFFKGMDGMPVELK